MDYTDFGSSNTSEESAWNLSYQIMMQIGNLLQSATNDFIHGRIQECYFKFQEIKLLIYADLKQEEINELEKLEKEVSVKFNRSLVAKNPNKVTDRLSHGVLVTNYRMLVMKLLKKYGYMPPRKKDSAKMF